MNEQMSLHPGVTARSARSPLSASFLTGAKLADKRFAARMALNQAPEETKGSSVVSAQFAAAKSTALIQLCPPSPISADWETLRVVSPGVRRHFLSGAALVNFFRGDPAARAFDLLRTRLVHLLRHNGWSRIAIAAPTHGCGSTFTAVNLAQSLARIPKSRTVLMDINHRSPGVAGMLELESAGDMRGFLSGAVPMTRHLVRTSETLALGLTSGPDPDAAEILHDARCGKVLNRMADALQPDVVLYDLPPLLEHDDLVAFLPQVDGVLLVADGTQTVARQIATCQEILAGQTRVLGVILNRARSQGLTRENA